MLAQTVMERVNVYAPHLELTSDETLSTISQTWTKKPSGVTPAALGTSSFQGIERDAIRALLENATTLQVYEDRPATLTVTMTAMPTATPAKKFSNASMVRIVVDLTWYEWGTRQRRVRLQALNLRTSPT